MKQNLEDIIKEQLENFEAPYDPSAWDQMNDKLDARSAKGQAPSSSTKLLKVVAAVAVVTIVAILIYTYSNTNDDSKTKSNSLELLEVQENKGTSIAEQNTTKSPEESEKATDKTAETIENKKAEGFVEETPLEIPQVPAPEKETPIKEVADQSQNAKNANESPVVSPDEKTADPAPKPTIRRKFISGVVSSTKICEGESLLVKNEGESEEYVKFNYNNKYVTISAGQQTQIKLNETSEIHFLNENNDVINTIQVAVFKKPQVDFSVESNIFDKGLPIVNLKAYGSYKSFNWEIDNKQLDGKSTQAHLFNQGTYDAILTVVDHNNCKTDKQRSISIENDYNLMAVSGFRPEGIDQRNRTFMPYALTQRDVEFTMVIIDSRDHGIVYKTQDASQPWDGIDQRTGKMTPADRAFIWKVQLDNALVGEKNMYVGTIVHD